jgi:hypothetical protein
MTSERSAYMPIFLIIRRSEIEQGGQIRQEKSRRHFLSAAFNSSLILTSGGRQPLS